jgi:hypothetical protein
MRTVKRSQRNCRFAVVTDHPDQKHLLWCKRNYKETGKYEECKKVCEKYEDWIYGIARYETSEYFTPDGEPILTGGTSGRKNGQTDASDKTQENH